MNHMFTPEGAALEKLKIILVSQSSSRKSILSQLITTNFTSMKSGFAEDLDKNLLKDPKQYCIETCRGKVNSFLEKVSNENIEFDIAIFCDTIIRDKDGNIFEKPVDKEDHKNMIKHLMETDSFAASTLIVLYDTNRIRQKIQNEDSELPEFCVKSKF